MVENSKPVYIRLRNMIAADILDGRYAEGEMLPSVRKFAAEQGANPLTVAKAYQIFQDQGLVRVQRGVGVFIVDGARNRLLAQEREAFLCTTWPDIARQIQRLELDAEKLLAENGSG